MRVQGLVRTPLAHSKELDRFLELAQHANAKGDAGGAPLHAFTVVCPGVMGAEAWLLTLCARADVFCVPWVVSGGTVPALGLERRPTMQFDTPFPDTYATTPSSRKHSAGSVNTVMSSVSRASASASIAAAAAAPAPASGSVRSGSSTHELPHQRRQRQQREARAKAHAQPQEPQRSGGRGKRGHMGGEAVAAGAGAPNQGPDPSGSGGRVGRCVSETGSQRARHVRQ